jgi:CHAD domain-containing protein
MADGKWVEGLGPKMHVGEAARRVLQARLEVVRAFLPLAVHDADRDPEYVHRLRVATRRSGAALRIFTPWLPEKAHRKAARRLRTLRRAAGAARDWDVFLIDLRERRKLLPVKEQPGIDFLIGYAAGQRDCAQEHLLDAGTTHGPGLKDFIDNTVAAVREPHGGDVHTLGDLGRSLLLDLLKELDWAAGRHLDDYEQLHQVRILGKQLRYAMEVFADCFPAAFRETIYPRVEEMQEVLGRANDSHVAEQRLAALRDRLRLRWPEDWKRYLAGIDGLLRFHRRRLPRERTVFLQWWKKWQEADSEALRNLLRSEAEGDSKHVAKQVVLPAKQEPCV